MTKEACDEKEECSSVSNLPTEMEKVMHDNGGLKKIKNSIPGKEVLTRESKVFKILSNPIRLQIMYALSISKLCPCILKDVTRITDSKLSYHLNILEKAGLISSIPRKKWRIYELTQYGKRMIDNCSVC